MMINGIELEFEPCVSPVDRAYEPVVFLSHNPILNHSTNLMVSLDDGARHNVVNSALVSAQGACRSCSSCPDTRGLVVVESWQIDDESQVQSFIEFEAICRDCLKCRDFINELEKGNRSIIMSHLMLKNDWKKELYRCRGVP